MTQRSPSQTLTPRASLEQATLKRGSRVIWKQLNLTVVPGEFIAILGPNGAGKTTILKALLGLIPIQAGTARLGVSRDEIGYLPQQKLFDPDLGIRGRDIVQLGLTGQQYGWSTSQGSNDQRVNEAIESVGATAYADQPIGILSGGEQQRLRIAQMLVNDPLLLLCDEPFLSLDANSQHIVGDLLAQRKRAEAGILFVTHDLNAEILPLVDRILYVVNGRWQIGTPDSMLTAKTLSALYGTPVGVIRAGGRVMVLPHSQHEAHSIDVTAPSKKRGR